MAVLRTIINLQNVDLRLNSAAGPVHILRGIDLTLHEGETVGIVGPSGSGKSTLMAVMSGLEQVTDGYVEVDGHDLTKMGEDALALHRRERIGIVLQSFHLIPTMTALENVAVPLELAGRKDAFERARTELEQVGLSHRLEHYPAQLSGGEQQRVALARAMAPDPAILFADEPTGNLDTKTGSTIIDLMFQLHEERQTTLILVTHDPALAARCDRVLHMADGVIVREDRGINSKNEAAQ
ncbi:ABC transporter [Iodidimonas gelatinilytica]|uniref:ABC transporter n=2 Tax=Iodidimonas TaxID=2066486 RepID=A0A5A7MVM8_9PROT|nr:MULTISPECIES: ABC transporter ATP-binding protein [Iodidimonas]GEQ98949.1 ABC transporter [Iodidimonas gelatinilytica]GER06889.1 ABC transporter [Kordiimonadales bacterium JCM 17843]GGO09599.1 ABC transporter [Iodidimonas muriae]